MEYMVRQVGVVNSLLKDRRSCPHQGSEGAPEALIEMKADFIEAMDGLQTGMEIILLTWMHLSDRSVLRVHPRGNPKNPLTGVFNTRSPDRPNPIGLHRAKIVSMESKLRFIVSPLEVVDGTPIIDLKCVLSDKAE